MIATISCQYQFFLSIDFSGMNGTPGTQYNASYNNSSLHMVTVYVRGFTVWLEHVVDVLWTNMSLKIPVIQNDSLPEHPPACMLLLLFYKGDCQVYP